MVELYSRKSIKFEEREDPVAWNDQEPNASISGENVEEEDPIMQVMLKSIQDPELAPIYKGLPDLGWALGNGYMSS